MPAGGSGPLRVAADFWSRESVQASLRERNIGVLFRLVRQFTGASQTQIGAAVALTQSHVSTIMNGQREATSLDLIDRIAQGLQMPDQMRVTLGLAPLSYDMARQTLVSGRVDQDDCHGQVDLGRIIWIPSETVESISCFTREDLSLDRREAVRTLAGVALGNALLERLEGWLSDPKDTTRIDRPPGVGYEEVEQIENSARLFRNWDNQFGGGLRRKAVIGQLSEVADELRDRSHPQDLRRRLFGAMAQLAETAATMSWDSGRGVTAQRYYIFALRAAKESGDRVFGANILAGMARQQLYLGNSSEALELVRLAQDGASSHAPPAVRAMLSTREAWVYANQGRRGAFHRATRKAEDLLTQRVREEEPYWIDYFDDAELAGVTGGRLLELAHETPGLAGDAATCIERAIDLRPANSLRSSALDQIGLAEARLVQGETGEASRLGNKAIEVVGKTNSDRVRVKLAELYAHTGGRAKGSAVFQLRDRIKETLSIRTVS
jgi:transcriptional regulator with XRE-family HTH domain